jgi:hypothetical protein
MKIFSLKIERLCQIAGIILKNKPNFEYEITRRKVAIITFGEQGGKGIAKFLLNRVQMLLYELNLDFRKKLNL